MICRQMGQFSLYLTNIGQTPRAFASIDLRSTHPKSPLSIFCRSLSLSFYLSTRGIFSICLPFLGGGEGGEGGVACYSFFACLLVLTMFSARVKQIIIKYRQVDQSLLYSHLHSTKELHPNSKQIMTQPNLIQILQCQLYQVIVFCDFRLSGLFYNIFFMKNIRLGVNAQHKQ